MTRHNFWASLGYLLLGGAITFPLLLIYYWIRGRRHR